MHCLLLVGDGEEIDELIEHYFLCDGAGATET